MKKKQKQGKNTKQQKSKVKIENILKKEKKK